MVYDHKVKYLGIWYDAGVDVPLGKEANLDGLVEIVAEETKNTEEPTMPVAEKPTRGRKAKK